MGGTYTYIFNHKDHIIGEDRMDLLFPTPSVGHKYEKKIIMYIIWYQYCTLWYHGLLQQTECYLVGKYLMKSFSINQSILLKPWHTARTKCPATALHTRMYSANSMKTYSFRTRSPELRSTSNEAEGEECWAYSLGKISLNIKRGRKSVYIVFLCTDTNTVDR
jgi:hypothetical protein